MSSGLVSNHWYVCDSVVNRTTRKKIKGLSKELDWAGATVGANKDLGETESKVDHNSRNSNLKWLKGDQWPRDLIWEYMAMANKEAGWEYDIDYAQDFQLTQYRKGMYYNWHQDGQGDHIRADNIGDDKGRVRKLSLTLLLNEGYEGGHFEFTRYGNECIDIVRPEFSKAGSIIVFPSHLEHRVTEVTRGVRHSLVAWFMGPPFR